MQLTSHHSTFSSLNLKKHLIYLLIPFFVFLFINVCTETLYIDMSGHQLHGAFYEKQPLLPACFLVPRRSHFQLFTVSFGIISNKLILLLTDFSVLVVINFSPWIVVDSCRSLTTSHTHIYCHSGYM